MSSRVPTLHGPAGSHVYLLSPSVYVSYLLLERLSQLICSLTAW